MKNVIPEKIKQLEDGIEVLEKCISNQPDSLSSLSSLYGELGNLILEKQNNVERAWYCYQRAIECLIQRREKESFLVSIETQWLIKYINALAQLLEGKLNKHEAAVLAYSQLVGEAEKQLQNVRLNLAERNYFLLMQATAYCKLVKIYAGSPAVKNLDLSDQCFTSMLNAQNELNNPPAKYWRILSESYEVSVFSFYYNNNFSKALLFCSAAVECLKMISEADLTVDDYKKLIINLTVCTTIAEEKQKNIYLALNYQKAIIHYATEVAENPSADVSTQSCYWKILAITNNKIANVFIASNSINDALEFVRRAIDAFKKIKSSDNKDEYNNQMAQFLYKSSILHQQINRPLAAQRYCQQAVDLLQEISIPTQVILETIETYNKKLEELKIINDHCAVNGLTARGSPVIQKRKIDDVFSSEIEDEKQTKELRFQ